MLILVVDRFRKAKLGTKRNATQNPYIRWLTEIKIKIKTLANVNEAVDGNTNAEDLTFAINLFLLWIRNYLVEKIQEINVNKSVKYVNNCLKQNTIHEASICSRGSECNKFIKSKQRNWDWWHNGL